MIYYTLFTHDDSTYLAYGEIELSRPLALQVDDREFVRIPAPRWPSWLKFAPYDDFELIEDGEVDSEEELAAKFGEIHGNDDERSNSYA